jgi:hypothetical protein
MRKLTQFFACLLGKHDAVLVSSTFRGNTLTDTCECRACLRTIAVRKTYA